MRWLNDIKIKINKKTKVMIDVLQVKGSLLFMTLVSVKNSLHRGGSTLVLIDSLTIEEE